MKKGAMGILFAGFAAAAAAQTVDPLPSWHDSAAKKAVYAFVARVTADGSPDFVPPAERIAAFDNDGTLWSEQPVYFQLAFALDRIKALAPQHPSGRRRSRSPRCSRERQRRARRRRAGRLRDHDGRARGHDDRGVRGDRQGLDRDGPASEDRPALHGDGLSADVGAPRLPAGPRLQDVHRLRRRHRVHPAVGGEGLRHPPEQVVGSSIKTRYELRDGRPVLVRLPEMEFYDDNVGKPSGIHSRIGRRPVMAFGNSDGDHQMFQWAAAGGGARLIGIVHHTDAEREWAYDRASAIGRLDKAWTRRTPGAGPSSA